MAMDPKDRKRGKAISVSEREWEALTEAAKSHGRSVSGYLLWLHEQQESPGLDERLQGIEAALREHGAKLDVVVDAVERSRG